MTALPTISKASPREQLSELLDEPLNACKVREQSAFDQLTADMPDLVLFGAGGLGRKVLQALRDIGRQPLAFVDNKLAGRSVEGLTVLSPAEAAALHGKSATFVVTIWASWADTMHEQVQSLRSFGCRSVISFIPLLWKFPDLLPHVQIDLPSRVLEQRADILRCFDLWSDDASRSEYIAQLRWRLHADFDALNPPHPDQYWQADLINLGDDAIFADAGAFDGDTLAQFLQFTRGAFRSAYVFEPDSGNLQNLDKRLQYLSPEVRARIHVCGAAVGDKDRDISFHQGSGISSSAGAGADSVRCVALDNALVERPDYIKYDIEGFVLLALQGSARIISRHRPALAVCAYHLQDHLWKIPLLIQSLNPNYRFFLRPHGQIWETVCYAIPT
jgi:FkbM family methyltransferase